MLDIAKERDYWKSLEGFTPGPWTKKVFRHINIVGVVHKMYDGVEHPICDMAVGFTQLDENTTLVTAAPELHRKYGELLDEIERLSDGKLHDWFPGKDGDE